MADITVTQTRYIRCIKPNPEKEPLKMNMFSSAEQLRCAGVVAAVTISRVAFPNRLMHETALERFSCLGHISLDSLIEKKKEASDDDETGYKEAVQILFQDLLKDMEKTDEGSVTRAFECGRSRIYFRTGALESLEAKRLVALGSFATVIERIVRGFTARSLFWKLKYASIDSQANARRVIGRNKFLRARAAAVRLECWVRCIFASNELMCLRREKASTRIQSMWRAFVAVVNYIRIKAASVIIQKIVRGAMQRPKYRQALKDAEEEARVNSKLAALQKRLQEAEMKFFQAEKGRIEAEKRAAEGGGSLVNAQVAESPATKPDLGDVPGGSAQQQALIDESNEMLDYFRKEVFKLKSANYLLRTDFAALQEEHRTLQSHVQSTEASYSAMRQNIAKLSQSNMRLAVELGEEKNFIQKLKKDLKMEKQRLSSEVKRKSEEVLGRDKMHEAEIATLKRELARMRQIIAQNGVKVSEHEEKSSAEHKFERASFHHNPLRESVLRNISVPQEEGGPASSLSRASLTSVVLSRPLITPPSSAPSSEDEGWTTVQSTRKPRYGQPPPPLGSYGSYGGRGRGGRHFNSPPPYRSGPPPYRGGAPRTPSSHAGRGRASPSYTTPGYTPPGLNPISPQVNAGTSLGAAAKAKSQNNLAALAQSGSSLAAAAATGNSSQSKSLPKRDSVTK
jgi:myosin heavy subunit